MDAIGQSGSSLGFWLQIVIFFSGCCGVALTSWRSQIGVRNEVEKLRAEFANQVAMVVIELKRLADQVEKQNGYVRSHGEELAALRERMSVEERVTKIDRDHRKMQEDARK